MQYWNLNFSDTRLTVQEISHCFNTIKKREYFPQRDTQIQAAITTIQSDQKSEYLAECDEKYIFCDQHQLEPSEKNTVVLLQLSHGGWHGIHMIYYPFSLQYSTENVPLHNSST